MTDLPMDPTVWTFPAIAAVQPPDAQPLLSAAMAELHTQIAQLPPGARASVMAAVDVRGNAKVVLVGRAGNGWNYVVTAQRYDGKLSGLAGVQKVW
jgi:hypothetical protein